MTNTIIAIVIALVCAAFYFGYTWGQKNTEFEYQRAEREARQIERENRRRFVKIIQQGAEIGRET